MLIMSWRSFENAGTFPPPPQPAVHLARRLGISEKDLVMSDYYLVPADQYLILVELLRTVAEMNGMDAGKILEEPDGAPGTWKVFDAVAFAAELHERSKFLPGGLK